MANNSDLTFITLVRHSFSDGGNEKNQTGINPPPGWRVYEKVGLIKK